MKACGINVEILCKLSQPLSSRLLTVTAFLFKSLQKNDIFIVLKFISHLHLKLRRRGITVLLKEMADRGAKTLTPLLALLAQRWMCLKSKALKLPYSVANGSDTNLHKTLFYRLRVA